MLEEIRDVLFRIGEQVNREQLFELSPLYFISHHENSSKHIQYLLNELRYDLANRNQFISKSNALLCYHLAYNTTDSELGLFDKSGSCKKSLDSWISYISGKYHMECGIIMISIDGYELNAQDYLWWRQFFSDIHTHKKKFLLFISCSSFFSTEIYSMFEKEFFTKMYQFDGFNVKYYFDWCIIQLEEYPITLDETAKTRLKNILAKNENDINHHVLEIWLNSLLWNYYGNKDFGEPIPFDFFSEELLRQIIERCHKDSSLKIGFCS